MADSNDVGIIANPEYRVNGHILYVSELAIVFFQISAVSLP